MESEESSSDSLQDRQSSTTGLFQRFQKLYSNQLKETDETYEGLKFKIKILENWVEDLTEQNLMLMKTVENLESEALQRICSVEDDVTQEQELDVTHGSRGDAYSPKVLQQIEALCNELDQVKQQLTDKENLITMYQTRIEKLGSSLEGEKSPCDKFDKSYVHQSSMTETMNDAGFIHNCESHSSVYKELARTQSQLSQMEKEVTQFKKKLKDADTNVKRLRTDLVTSERNAREMRAALTAEVADKHDQVLALRREVSQLEDQLRQADMQTHFKDDIIKELRKEVKVARSKLEFLGLYSPDCNPSLDKIEVIKPPPQYFPDKLSKTGNDDLMESLLDVSREVDSIIKSRDTAVKASSVQYANKSTCTSPARENKSEQFVKYSQNKRFRSQRHFVRKQTFETSRETDPELILERTEVCPVHGDVSVWTTICMHSKEFL